MIVSEPRDHRFALLRLLQLADSGFPTGAFAFSHGLEGLVEERLVRGEGEVAAVLRAQIEESLAGVEAPAARHAHRFAAAGDVDGLIDLDGELTALKPVPAFYAASTKVGRRLLASSSEVIDGPPAAAYRRAVTEGQAAGHQAVAYGVVLQTAGLDEETTALALAAGFVASLAAAAVRLGVIGQSAAQRTIAALHPSLLAAVERSRRTEIDEMGGYLPMVDLAGLRQPALAGRLFGS